MHLTTAQREGLPPSAFLLPGRRALPVTDARGHYDPDHIRAAAGRLSMMRNRGSVSPGEYHQARGRLERAKRAVGMGAARDNPAGEVGMGVGAALLFGGAGAVIGALTMPPVLSGSFSGAELGLGLLTVLGFGIGAIDPSRRDGAFAAGGVGLLSWLGLSLLSRVIPGA